MTVRPGRAAAALFLGSLLLQLAWMAVVPPFHAVDEVDHAYRTAAVAAGQWRPAYQAAQDGRGDLLRVPADVVAAAHEACTALEYNGADNCPTARPDPDGTVEAASAASRYNPVFYAVIGWPASLARGTTSLYLMRLTGSLLCSGLLALAGAALALWARTVWPFVGTAVALVPMVTFSDAVGAPNGCEMCAGALLWASLLGLGGPSLPPRTERTLLALAGLAGVVLGTVRTLGPLWLALTVLSVLAWVGPAPAWAVVRRNPRVTAAVSLAVAVAGAAGAAWSLSTGTNWVGDTGTTYTDDPLLASLVRLPLWVMQSVGAFPTRSGPAPMVTYAVALLALLLVLGSAWRGAPRRSGVVLLGVVLTGLVVPVLLSASTFERLGPVWQGRYALPYVVGTPLLAAAALDRVRAAVPARHLLVLLGAGLAVGHTAAALSVLHLPRYHRAGVGPGWLEPPAVLVVALCLAGTAVLLAPALRLPVQRTRRAPALARTEPA